jgi:hypothetical protein
LLPDKKDRVMPDDQSAVIDHSLAMSPAEATTMLDQMSAALRGPLPLQATTAAEARQRLNALSSDSAWVRAYFAGDMKARQEAESLNATIANATLAEELAGGPQDTPPVEVTFGQDSRRGDYLSVAADLRALWGDEPEGEGAIAELLDPERTSLDPALVAQAQRWKAEALRDPEFVRAVLDGAPEETKRLRLWDAIIAIGAP